MVYISLSVVSSCSFWDVRTTISDFWVNRTFSSFAHNVSYEGGRKEISRIPSPHLPTGLSVALISLFVAANIRARARPIIHGGSLTLLPIGE